MYAKLQKFLRLSKDFGLWFSVRYYYLRETKRYNEYIDFIQSKLVDILRPVITKYSDYECNPHDLEKKTDIIWVCWWQGFDNMPPLCKMCFERLKAVAPQSYEIKLITRENYTDYIEIPKAILEKLDKGTLSVTQFSDILREGLLYYKGGLWLDASIWVNEYFFETIDKSLDFWSVKLNSIHNKKIWGQLVSECQWTGFLLYGKKGNIVSKFTYEAMCYYFCHYDSTVDYFIQNLIIRIGIDHVEEIKDAIDSIKPSNSKIYELYEIMDLPFEKEKWEEICSNTGAFKLTQKREYLELASNHMTYYSHLKRLSDKNYSS